MFLCVLLPAPFCLVGMFKNEHTVFLPILIKKKGFETELFEFLTVFINSITL